MKFYKFLFLIFISTIISFQCKPFESNETTKHAFSNVKIIITAENTDLRIKETGNVKFNPVSELSEGKVWLFVYPKKKYQHFIGIGGAITDASAETFFKLSQTNQNKLIEAYYDKNKGISYSIIRTNMNSCDFSSDMYTYIDEGDKELKSFNISHDEKYKIPLLRKAIETSGNSKLFLSPWSPPAFMKSNDNMLHGGQLLPEYFQSWADYYVKFIEKYKEAGIDIWGLTIQNEPMATQTWESCIYSAEQERDFLKNYLGPTLHKNNL
ncbi:MAG: hypothetical protein R2771_01225 [Saprospiraceae bacterium]